MAFTSFSESEANALSLVDINGHLKARADRVQELIKKAGPEYNLVADEVAELREVNTQMSALSKARDSKLELQKMAARAAQEIEDQTSAVDRLPMPENQRQAREAVNETRAQYIGLGDQFVSSVAFKEYNKSYRRSPEAELDVGGIMSMRYHGAAEQKTLMVSTDVAGTIQPMAMFGGNPLEMLQRRPVVADLMPQGETTSPSLRYVEETVNTNNAAFVSEGGTKPESALQFADRTASVRKIATVLPVTDELFADAPAMRSYVEARLRLFMALAEEASLISGTGSAPEYYGLMTVAGTQTKTVASAGGNVLDALYQAMVLVQTGSFLDPSGVIMNPLDWQDIITLKTDDGIYIWGQPNAAPGPERVWGLPVVKTPVMTQNTAIVAAFNSSMQIFRREGVSFAVSDSHNDFFITNKLMLRVEERLAFVVYRPAGICKVTGV